MDELLLKTVIIFRYLKVTGQVGIGMHDIFIYFQGIQR